MPAFGLEQFRNPPSRVVHKVPLPAYGPDAYTCVRELGADDLVALRASYGKEGNTDNLTFVFDVLARTICDDGGALLFTNSAACQAGFGLPVKTLQLISEEVMKHAGLTVQEKN